MWGPGRHILGAVNNTRLALAFAAASGGLLLAVVAVQATQGVQPPAPGPVPGPPPPPPPPQPPPGPGSDPLLLMVTGFGRLDGCGQLTRDQATAQFVRGSSCVFRAIEDYGYQFKGWQGSGFGSGTRLENPITLTNDGPSGWANGWLRANFDLCLGPVCIP